MDLEGLEDVADFWNMDIDDIDQENIPIKDLTVPQSGDTSIYFNHELMVSYNSEDKIAADLALFSGTPQKVAYAFTCRTQTSCEWKL
jgi:hypothetical protein